MATNYQRGAYAEYRAKAALEAKGFHVTRAAGSKSKFDLIATNTKLVMLVQCKRTKDKSKRFHPEGIKELRSVRVPNAACVQRQLWVLVDGYGWVIQLVKPRGKVSVLTDAVRKVNGRK